MSSTHVKRVWIDLYDGTRVVKDFAEGDAHYRVKNNSDPNPKGNYKKELTHTNHELFWREDKPEPVVAEEVKEEEVKAVLAQETLGGS